MENLKLEIRDKSIITGSSNLEELVEYDQFPIYIGCTDKDKKEDIKANLKFMICKDSGCIQSFFLLPIDILYSGKFAEALGEKWKKHHQTFCNFIKNNSKDNILEVGGSNGYLANEFFKLNKSSKIKWTIIEPNLSDNPVKHKNIDFIENYFDKNLNFDRKRTIVHSHVFEHIYEPLNFLSDISNYLEEKGRHIFSIPNLPKYLDNRYSNTINFEHTFYFTQELIEYIASKFKFKIVDKYEFENHSIFYAFEKDSSIKPKPLPNQYKKNKESYKNFIAYYRNVVDAMNKYIEKNSEKEVFLFGGHIFSQFLIYLGLNEKRIKFILDNSDEKNGLRLYGSDLFVEKPDIIKTFREPIVIVFAGQYQKEVESQIKGINPNCLFVNPENYLNL